jgi:hypothetical protein
MSFGIWAQPLAKPAVSIPCHAGGTGPSATTSTHSSVIRSSRASEQGFVKFDYQGRQPELVRHRITVDDARWAADLLDRLTETQWRDAFRAGGYEPALAESVHPQDQGHIAAARQLTTVLEPNVVDRES